MINSVSRVNQDNRLLELRERLQKVFQAPKLFVDFPVIPENIIESTTWFLKWGYSIYKKWTAYYIIDDAKWTYLETMDLIESKNIVFSFTEYELNSHIWLRIVNIIERQEDDKTREYAEILRSYVYKQDLWSLDIPISTREKIIDLMCDAKPENTDDSSYFAIPWVLEHITLEKTDDGFYYVPHTSIHFSEQELHILKERACIT